MAEAPRITVEELKKRMDAGEDFTVIDVRNPNAWAETDTVIPEAIRVPLDKLEENLPRISKNRPAVASYSWLLLDPVVQRPPSARREYAPRCADRASGRHRQQRRFPTHWFRGIR